MMFSARVMNSLFGKLSRYETLSYTLSIDSDPDCIKEKYSTRHFNPCISVSPKSRTPVRGQVFRISLVQTPMPITDVVALIKSQVQDLGNLQDVNY